MARGKGIVIEAADGAGVRPFDDSTVLFVFDRKTSRTMKGHIVNLTFAEKLAIESVCLASFYECIKSCGEECRESECRQALNDCISNPDAFVEHAKFVYERFAEKVEEKER